MSKGTSNSPASDDLSPNVTDAKLISHREQVLEAVQRNGFVLENFEDFQNDQEIVLDAIKRNVNAFKFAHESLRNDRDFIKQAIQANSQVFYHLEPSLRSDRELLFCRGILDQKKWEELFKKFARYEQDSYIKELDEKIFNPIKEKIAHYQNTNTDESEQLKNAFENLLYQCNFAIARRYHIYARSDANAAAKLSENFKNTIKQQLNQTLSNLKNPPVPVRNLSQHLLDELQGKNDRDAYQDNEVLAVERSDSLVREESQNFPHQQQVAQNDVVPNQVTNDLQAHQDNSLNSDSESKQLEIEKNEALEAVQSDGLALKNFSAFQADKEIVLAAIKQNNEAFSYADENLRNDRDFIKQAIKENSRVFALLPSLKSDRELLFCSWVARQENRDALLEKFAEYDKDPYIKELDEKILNPIKQKIARYKGMNTEKAEPLKNAFENLLYQCNTRIVNRYYIDAQVRGDAAVAQLSEESKVSIKKQLTETLNQEVKCNKQLNVSLTPVRDLCKKLLGVLLLIPTGGLPLLSMNYRTYFFATADKYQVYQLAQQVAHIDTQADTNSIKSERDTKSISAEHGNEPETSKLSLT